MSLLPKEQATEILKLRSHEKDKDESKNGFVSSIDSSRWKIIRKQIFCLELCFLLIIIQV